jgi:hypothetical protein
MAIINRTALGIKHQLPFFASSLPARLAAAPSPIGNDVDQIVRLCMYLDASGSLAPQHPVSKPAGNFALLRMRPIVNDLESVGLVGKPPTSFPFAAKAS